MADNQMDMQSEAHIRKLVAKLASGSTAQQLQVIKQIFDSYNRNDHNQWMLRLCAACVEVEGAMGALVALLSDPQAPLALWIFTKLCNIESFRHAIHSSQIPVMSTLASLLESSSPNLQQLSVVALGLLPKSMSLARDSADDGIVEKLVKLLRGESGSETAWKAARSLYSYVCTSHTRARRAAVAGAMPHLAAVATATSSAEGQGYAAASMTAILNYVRPSLLPERQVTLVAEAGALLLRDAINQKGHESAMLLLCHLRQGGPSLLVKMLSLGVHQHATQHLLQLPPALQKEAMALMVDLLRISSPQQLAAAAKAENLTGAAELLLESEDADTRLWAARMLAYIMAAAPEDASVASAAIPGIVPAMVRAMTADGGIFSGIMLQALGAMLLHLDRTELGQQAVEAGVLPLLLAALQGGDEEASANAVNAACNLGKLLEPEQVPEGFAAVVEHIIGMVRSAAPAAASAAATAAAGSASEEAQSWMMALYNAALKSAELAQRIDSELGPVLQEYQQAGRRAGRTAAAGAALAAAGGAQRLRCLLQARREQSASLADDFEPAMICTQYYGLDLQHFGLEQHAAHLGQAEATHQEVRAERKVAKQAQLAACAKCGATSKREGGGPLLHCSTCQAVAYCSKGCQKGHWRVHKKDCRR